MGGFWAGYQKSLKPLAVEEPIDVYLHRPLGYLVALAAARIPFVTPNLLTLCSVALGFGCAALIVLDSVPGHMVLAALLLLGATVFDCSDGQLARMRGTSSVFGRMLDGSADFFVTAAVVGACGYSLFREYGDPWWVGVIILLVLALTSVTTGFHTQTYDYYKNLYLHVTDPSRGEGETYESARARYESQKAAGELSWVERTTWQLYFLQLTSQRDIVSPKDPYLGNFADAPKHSPETAKLYARHNEPVMRLWKGWFGVGTLMFGMTLAIAFNALLFYVVLRVVGQNAFYFGYVLPRQRRASKAVVDELAALSSPS